MTISVLIPAYGDQAWCDLAWSRAFPSAAEQTEDAHVFYDPDGTIASVRNELAKFCDGEWLLFLDADDELAPGFLDAMRRAIERTGDGPVLLTPAINHPGRFYKEGPIQETNWLVVGTLIERNLFLAIDGFPELPHGFEDWALWVKAVQAGARIVKVPNAVYVRHPNPDSEMRRTWGDPVWQVATHKRIFAELFPEA